ncbi:MAG: hypothetical protein AABZ10_14755 [Nitrospirota bacterium]
MTKRKPEDLLKRITVKLKMAPELLRPGFRWILFNIVLFSGYLVFGVVSFFYPSTVKTLWIILLYLVTMLVNYFIIYGLIKRISGIPCFIVVVSSLMIAHLLIFIYLPLGMELAYIGPSRGFYSLFILFLSLIVNEHVINRGILAFNIVMVFVHAINIIYFTRSRVVALFKHNPFDRFMKSSGTSKDT